DLGNGAGETACAAGSGTALDTLATGEVAAFKVSDTPRHLADLAFNDGDGMPTDLGAFAGRTVLVNLWATWCAPCRAEMPALARLQEARGGDDFTVVAVNLDTGDTAKAKAFLHEVGADGLDFYADPTTGLFTALKQRGMALGLPTTVLVDPSGCQLGIMAGPAEWDSPDAIALIDAALEPGS